MQLHKLWMMKSWVGPGNKARLRVSGAVRAFSARAIHTLYITKRLHELPFSTSFSEVQAHIIQDVKSELVDMRSIHAKCAGQRNLRRFINFLMFVNFLTKKLVNYSYKVFYYRECLQHL